MATADPESRAEVHFEHTQIANRVGWHSASQSLLLVAFAQEGYASHFWVRMSFVSIGIFTSVLVFIGILAAINRIKNHGGHCDKLHKRSLWYPIFAPPAVIVVWIVIAISSL